MRMRRKAARGPGASVGTRRRVAAAGRGRTAPESRRPGEPAFDVRHRRHDPRAPACRRRGTRAARRRAGARREDDGAEGLPATALLAHLRRPARQQPLRAGGALLPRRAVRAARLHAARHPVREGRAGARPPVPARDRRDGDAPGAVARALRSARHRDGAAPRRREGRPRRLRAGLAAGRPARRPTGPDRADARRRRAARPAHAQGAAAHDACT